MLAGVDSCRRRGGYFDATDESSLARINVTPDGAKVELGELQLIGELLSAASRRD